ncbi:MAG: choice-of-anchor D domain-containing protein [Prevotella sp.]|nr:choice-of-anchor D domain-containing protein [Prevotella sp.]
MIRLQPYVFILCMALSLMAAMPMSAQSAVSLTSVSGHPGEEVEVSVMLSGAQSATALQINIPHTPYVSYVEGSAVLNAQRVSESHTFSVSDEDNKLNLYVYDVSLNTFKEGKGALMTFRLKLGNEPGTYALSPEAMLSDAAAQSLSVSAQGGTVTILCPKISLGMSEIDYGSVPIRSTHKKEVSVNNIGNEPLNVSEITSTSALFKVSPTSMTIAAGQQKTLTIEYSPTQYGSDQTDITLLSDASNGRQTIHVTAAPFSVNTLSVTGASGQSGDEVTVRVSMQNMEPIVATQCCFTLPDALKYVEGSATLSGRTTNGSHEISGTMLGDKLSFYIHSSTNAVLSGNEGELFTFKLLLNGTGGDYRLDPIDVLLSNADGQDMTSEVNGTTIRIAAPKITCASELEFGRIPLEDILKKKFAIKNTGEAPLVIQRVDFSKEAFTLTEAANLPTIAAGETTEIEVCYHPAGEEAFDGFMNIYSNDPENKMQTVVLSGTTYAVNEIALSGQPVSGKPGQYAITITMKNTLPVAGMQFDLHWIAGMVPVKEEFTFSSRATDYQVEITKQSDDCYRVYVYSEHNTPITVGDGSVITLIYNKVEGLASYDKTNILADQIILSTAEGRDCASSPTATLQVGGLSGLMGDANNDGHVSVTDISCVVDYILERDSSEFTKSQADMNQDGRITVTDVVQIIHAILQ